MTDYLSTGLVCTLILKDKEWRPWEPCRDNIPLSELLKLRKGYYYLEPDFNATEMLIHAQICSELKDQNEL